MQSRQAEFFLMCNAHNDSRPIDTAQTDIYHGQILVPPVSHHCGIDGDKRGR
jgi:hypothetical protein